MPTPDFTYCWSCDLFLHPETDVTILGEDMPDELRPEEVRRHTCVVPWHLP